MSTTPSPPSGTSDSGPSTAMAAGYVACPTCTGITGHPMILCGECGRSIGEPRPLACEGVTYVSASYSKEYDDFVFEASCDGPQLCGWAIDLTDHLAPDVTEQGMALLSQAHHAHSAERASASGSGGVSRG